MSETRFDDIIKNEEKKNTFDKARESVRGADMDCETEQRPVINDSKNTILDINAIFSDTTKEKMENKTFYLKISNIKKLQKISKSQNNISMSKVLDKILDNIN